MALAVTLVVWAAQAHAQKVSVHVEPAQSEIHWTLGDVTHTVKGTFTMKGGVLTYDPQSGAADGQLLVEVGTGDSGSHARDAKMKKDVLEVQKYPQAFFHPAKISGLLKSGTEQQLTAEGTLNIHGVDHPLTLVIAAQLDGQNVTAKTHFVVPYVAWGMKDPSFMMFRVAKQVDVDVTLRGRVEGIQ